MGENFPKAGEICKIIAACRKAGVSVLKYGALEVTFARAVEPGGEAAPNPQPIHGAPPTLGAVVAEETIQAQERVEEASIEEQGIQAREQQIAELLLSDPLLAEEMMEAGDLAKGESTDGAESGEALDQ